MTCREIPVGVRDSARSLEDVYTRLGVLPGTGGNPLPPPELIRPDGIPATAFPYLGGTEGRDFNLAPLYDNNGAGLTCVLSSLGYNETRAREIDTAINGLNNDETQINAYLDNLSVGDRRTYSLFTTLQVMNFFRGTGNTDGVQNVISMTELAAWAWERCGHDQDTHQATAASAIRRMHALLGLAIFLQTEPPPPPRTLDTRAAENHVPSDSITFAAPQGGWQTGDQIFINGTLYRPLVAPSGNTQINIPGSDLRSGLNTIEVKNGTNTWVSMPVTIAAAPAPVAIAPEHSTGESSWWNRTGWLGLSNSTWTAIGGGVAATGLVTLLGVRLRGARSEARLEGEARARSEREAREAGSARDAAEARVRELSDQVSGARGALDGIRPDVPTIEARIRNLEAELRRAQDNLEDAREGLEFKGNARQRGQAESRFDAALQHLEAKEAEAATERSAVRDIEARNPDDPMLPQHREALARLEAEVQSARNAFSEASRQSAKTGDVAARDQAAQKIHDARAEVRRIESELSASRATLSQAQGIGNAYNLLGAAPRPATPTPPPPVPAHP